MLKLRNVRDRSSKEVAVAFWSWLSVFAIIICRVCTVHNFIMMFWWAIELLSKSRRRIRSHEVLMKFLMILR
jgi:hypothetical protein